MLLLLAYSGYLNHMLKNSKSFCRINKNTIIVLVTQNLHYKVEWIYNEAEVGNTIQFYIQKGTLPFSKAITADF